MQRQTKCCWRALELLSLAGQDRFQCCRNYPATNVSHHSAATVPCLPGDCPELSQGIPAAFLITSLQLHSWSPQLEHKEHILQEPDSLWCFGLTPHRQGLCTPTLPCASLRAPIPLFLGQRGLLSPSMGWIRSQMLSYCPDATELSVTHSH